MILKVSNLSKNFGQMKALDKISFQINQGDIFGFLGPNGSGKTTTIRIICSILKADSGSIEFNGKKNLENSSQIKAMINYLPESFGLYDWMNAKEYLHFFSGLYKVPVNYKLLNEVGLEIDDDKKIGIYSKGMKQRLGLARALINSPQLLLLDEPTSGLDPRGRKEIQELLIHLNKTKGISILLSTHLLDDVDRLCNRIAIINKGKIVEEGFLNELEEMEGRKYFIRTKDKIQKPLYIQYVDLKEIRDGYSAELHKEVTISEVLKKFIQNDVEILELVEQRKHLEDVFLQTTKEQSSL